MGGYYYLWANLMGLPLLFVGMACAGEQRRWAVASGLLFLPFVVTGDLFVGSYWQPQKLFNLSIGIEDLLFAFQFGTMAWLCMFWPWRRQIQIGVPTRRSLAQAAACSAVATFAVWLLGRYTGIMHAFIMVQTGLAAVLILLRPGLARVVPRALATSTGLYVVWMLTTAKLFPGFASLWPGTYLSTIAGVPVEEFLWAASAAVCFPYYLAVTSNVQLVGCAELSPAEDTQ